MLTVNRHRDILEFYQVAHLRTDGVHYREAAGAGPVLLKVVPNGGGGGGTSSRIKHLDSFPAEAKVSHKKNVGPALKYHR